MKHLFLSTLVGLTLASPVTAQDSFDVQRAMETVRKENLQRIGVERQQQIVSTLRKRAEDLAAIKEAGFTVTADGRLEPMETGQPDPALRSGPSDNGSSGVFPSEGGGNEQAGNNGLFFQGEGDAINPDAETMPAWMKDALNASPDNSAEEIALKAILSNRAVLRVNGSERRYREGDKLPNGFTLIAVNPRSVEVKKGEGGSETLYMDWSSASKSVRGASETGDSDSEPATFMQSGQPVEGFGAGF